MVELIGSFLERIRSVPIVAVLLIGAIGVSLSLQGWRSRNPYSDMLPYFDAADRLLTHKEIPNSGALTSYSSYAPPGPSWLILPGLVLFSDPRLFESVGSAILYFGTLIGIFLLARLYFGDRSALLATAIYGLSELGLLVGNSLYVRFSLHFFYVWIVYCAVEWVRRGNAKYLAIATIIWSAGMYVYMEIAPALFILPALWLIYRPPVRLFSLAVAGLLALAIWYPYLKFEYGRDFLDVKSQVARTRLLPLDYKDSWCDSRLLVGDWKHTLKPNGVGLDEDLSPTEDAESKAHRASLYALFAASYALVERVWHAEILLPNYQRVAPIPGSSLALLLLTLTSISLLSFGPRSAELRPSLVVELWRGSLTPLAVAMIAVAAVANEFVLKHLSSDATLEQQTLGVVRQLQALLALVGVILLGRKRLFSAAGQLAIFRRLGMYAKNAKDTKPLVVSLLVPWVILFFIAEADRGDRFWWLWPVQVIVLVALFTSVLPRLGMPRAALALGQAWLALVVIANPLLSSRAHSWLRTGWSGSDSDELRAMDYIAGDIHSQGKKQANVGYQIFIWAFMPSFNIIDSRYKVGADFDFLLNYRHGVSNGNRCAEGLSPNDEYRIVQLRPTSEIAASQKYIAAPLNDNFHMTRQFGVYQVFKRR
jgi:Dolichyl-phosphate-mannose-protein mannosyltransferase